VADIPADMIKDLAEAKLLDLSLDVYRAVGDQEPPADPPRFVLPEVVSGKYVERLFHMLLTLGSANAEEEPKA
jgi:hypothetical protein